MIKRSRRGAVTVEMTLVGIPIIFTLISIFEMARGMWIYETAAHSVREGVRFASVHGYNCVNNPPAVVNSCAISAADVTARMRTTAVGLDPVATNVTFTAGSGSALTCTLAGAGSGCTGTWPPTGGLNGTGTLITIRLTTPFRSALAMFWPGAAAVSFGVFNLGASSSDRIIF